MKRKRISKKDRLAVFNKFNGHCAYCGCEITEKNFVVDHVNPVFSGGGNEIGNLFPTCRSCNNYKHFYDIGDYEDTKSWWTFRNQLADLPKQLKLISIFRIALRFGIVKIGNWDRRFYYESVFTVKERGIDGYIAIKSFDRYSKAVNWVRKNKKNYVCTLDVFDGYGNKYVVDREGQDENS